ncbi:MAG TPA: YlbF family regulator [Symbiobacteriaceae bacterium]|nr:YlbF family regulator [Symbiobacteriaceae bacterium]
MRKHMVNVYDYAHSLARALKESQEYRAYQAARARIKAKPAAEEMVKDFHKKQLDLQALVLQGKEPSKEQKEALERLYGVIQGDADVRDYLAAEQRLSVILNDVYKILGEAIEVELPGAEK